MIKQIAGTFSSRMVVLFSTLGVVVLNTRYLGQEGQGEIALINLAILIIVSISNIVGGGALVYLIPRMGIRNVVAPAILWALISAGLGTIVVRLFWAMDNQITIHVGVLALLQSLFFFLHQIILSREKIRIYNVLLSIQTLSLLLSVFVAYAILGRHSVDSFIICLYISFGITLLASMAKTQDALVFRIQPTLLKDTIRIIRHGFYSQGGNVIHLLNQRGGLYLLKNSLFSAGIFSLCLYAAEAIWNVSKSISLVQHSRISNLEDKGEIRAITISFMKLSLLFTAPMVILAACIPDQWFSIVFGQLEGLHQALVIFSPAILLHSITLVFSHYFSGTGLHKHNMCGAATGLAVLAATGPWLTLFHGLNGTVMAASSGLLANFFYHLYQFNRLEKLTWKDLRINRSVLDLSKQEKRS